MAASAGNFAASLRPAVRASVQPRGVVPGLLRLGAHAPNAGLNALSRRARRSETPSRSVTSPLPPLDRRRFLRLLGLGASGGLLASCQQLMPPPLPGDAPVETSPTPEIAPATPTPIRVPTPTRVPTVASAAASPTFRVAVDVDPDSLDPAGQTTTTVANVVDYMVETLVTLQPDGSLGPGLAEKWEQSVDGRVYTFTLRAGVRFHDGADFNAEAARLSLERVLSPRLNVPLRAPLDGGIVESIQALDATHLEIRLGAPFGPLAAKLASTEMGIVSPNHARGFPDSYNDEPVGTGPYRFRERHKGESVTLDRFDGYRGKRPYYDVVQFRIVPEAATRESLLLADQVEMIIQPPVADLPALQRTNTVKVVLGSSSRTVFVAMDLTYPGGTPLAIKKVRQALNYAVDKDAIVKNVLAGAAAPMDSPMPPSLFGYSRVGPYQHDENRARQLLLEAGTPSLLLRVALATGRSVQDTQMAQVAQAIAGNLRDVNVLTELVAFDWASYLAAVNVPEDRGSAHMHLFTWQPTVLDGYQQMMLFSKSQWPPRGLATSHYTNPNVEDLLSRALQAPDQQTRRDLYARAEKIVWDDAPWIFLWVPSYPLVHSARVKGIGSLPVEKFAAVYAEPA